MTVDRGTPLVERDAELAALVSTLDAARAGAGSVVLIEGPAGIGKTALVHAARRRAAQDGMRVLHGRGTAFEREYPFGVVRQCLEPVVRRAEDRARLLTGAAQLAEPVLLGAPDDAGAAPVGLLHGLYWLVADLADEAPVAVFVDDAHWADEPSLRFLAYLARRIDSVRGALVIGTRQDDDPGSPAGRALTEIRGEARLGRLQLRPLGSDAVAQLLRDRGGQDVEAAFAQACHAATGGNPFLLEELARTLLADGVPFTAASTERVGTVAPATVAAAVAATLARLGPQARPSRTARLCSATARRSTSPPTSRASRSPLRPRSPAGSCAPGS